MNTDAVIAAEHDLFFKVCDGKLLLKDEIDSEIRKIIAAFVQCSEIKRFMKKHNLAKRDFEYIYEVLFSVTDFFEFLYVGEIKCLFPTAVLLSKTVIDFMGMYLENRNKFINETRTEFLAVTALECGNLFFRREAVKQNIVDKTYYLTLKHI